MWGLALSPAGTVRTWSVEGQQLGGQGVPGAKRDQIQVFDAAVVVGHHTKALPAAKVRVEGHVGRLLLLCGRVEPDQTQLLEESGGEAGKERTTQRHEEWKREKEKESVNECNGAGKKG